MHLPNGGKIYVGFCLCIGCPAPASSQTGTPIDALASGVVDLFCDPHGNHFYHDVTRSPSNPTDVADGETDASAACPSNGLTGSGHAWSMASLRGTLFAHADANSTAGTPPSDPFYGVSLAGAAAHAEFTNSVIYNPPPNNPPQEKEYIIGMRVDGRLEQSPGQTRASGNVCINVNYSGNVCTLFGYGGASGSNPLPFIFTKKLVLLGPTVMTVVESLDADADAIGNKDGGSSSSSADFGESVQTFVQLPPGWTFTSSSGDFLSYQIRVLQSGRCLDADTGSIGGNGTKVQLWDCWGGPNQSWSVNSDGTIVNLQSARCLDADTGNIGSNGTKVQLWDCTGGQNQKWVWPGFAPSTGPGGSDNRNVQSGRCLDADTGTIGSNGTNVQLWDCGGGQNQVWAH